MKGLAIPNQRAFASGALFLAFAIFFFVEALAYPAGTAAKMGAGYFPLLLGIVLAAMGAILIARSVVVVDEPISPFNILPLVIITTAV